MFDHEQNAAYKKSLKEQKVLQCDFSTHIVIDHTKVTRIIRYLAFNRKFDIEKLI